MWIGTATGTLRLALCGAGLSVAMACTGPSAHDGDTGAEAQSKALAEKLSKNKKSAVRTRENPNVPMTEAELAEFDAFCKAMMQCHKERCDPDKQARVFKAVKTTTEWGESLQKHFMGNPMDAIGRRLAKLVDEEHLERKSRACRDVSATFD